MIKVPGSNSFSSSCPPEAKIFVVDNKNAQDKN
jgi:hypothetical protein